MMASNISHAERELDLINAGRGLWLVKVPKFIANRWERTPGGVDAGELRITKYAGRKAEASLMLSEAVLALKETDEKEIPKEYKLDVTPVTSQTLGVFSHVVPSTSSDNIVSELDKIFMEGRIVQKLECRPVEIDDCYMKLKMDSIRKACAPRRQIKRLDKVVRNFKPVSDHKHNIEYSEKKKAEGKKMRDDKDAVLNVLFAAFEKHQYYNIKDLVKITRQPIVYLKEILNEFCNYNIKNPHRNMWELKPEYRCYKEEEKLAESTSKKGNESEDD